MFANHPRLTSSLFDQFGSRLPVFFTAALVYSAALVPTAVLVSTLLPSRASADFTTMDLIPGRRDNPAKTEQGFMAFPIYTHVPGIGSTFGLGFLSSNILKTRTNVLGALTAGDSSLAAFGVTEVHLLSKNLFFNFYGYSTRIPFQLYERGMGSSSDGYVNLLRKEYGATAEMNFHFWDRRLQFNAMVAPSRLQLTSARSAKGVQFNANDSNEVDTLGTTMRLQLDLTDDDLDPRQGMKLQVLHHQSNVYDAYHSRYYSLSAFSTFFVPVSRSNTWAFNIFRSGSAVTTPNDMNETELRQGLGLNCATVVDPEQQQACQGAEDRRVKERLAENRYGTAALLGGPTQLRGFPIGRYRGSQTLMYATEFRWNLTDESTQFDFGFISGTRSLLQIAPFIEWGASVDPPNTVENAPLMATYGIGFRMGFSGALLRADLGVSHEGPQFTFFFGYPWDLSIL